MSRCEVDNHGGSTPAEAALAFVAFVAFVSLATWLMCGCSKGVIAQPEHAAGQPLDICTYDAPEYWRECRGVTKVTDTRTNQSWWVIRLYDQYVVLPIEELGETS